MVVDVEEGKTGHLGFGIGFSTLEKAMMFAEIRQGNFDIMRWRSQFFQGDGQKFRLRLKLGSRSNEARLALEEPWFLNRRLAAGFELFEKNLTFKSSYYDELRAGFEIYFRKRLFELVEGRLFYSYEDVLIDDIDVSLTRTQFIRDDSRYNPTANEIQRVISKVGLTLSRDTRDALLFPPWVVLSRCGKNLPVVFSAEMQIMGVLKYRGHAFFKPMMRWSKYLQFLKIRNTWKV